MDFEGIVIFIDFVFVLGRAHMQSVHACAVQTHFSVFVFCLKKGGFGLPFWSILEALGGLLAPRGCPGVLSEGSEKEVEKRGPPNECGDND